MDNVMWTSTQTHLHIKGGETTGDHQDILGASDTDMILKILILEIILIR